MMTQPCVLDRPNHSNNTRRQGAAWAYRQDGRCQAQGEHLDTLFTKSRCTITSPSRLMLLLATCCDCSALRQTSVPLQRGCFQSASRGASTASPMPGGRQTPALTACARSPACSGGAPSPSSISRPKTPIRRSTGSLAIRCLQHCGRPTSAASAVGGQALLPSFGKTSPRASFAEPDRILWSGCQISSTSRFLSSST